MILHQFVVKPVVWDFIEAALEYWNPRTNTFFLSEETIVFLEEVGPLLCIRPDDGLDVVGEIWASIVEFLYDLPDIMMDIFRDRHTNFQYLLKHDDLRLKELWKPCRPWKYNTLDSD